MGRTRRAVGPSWHLTLEAWTPPSCNRLWKAGHWSVGHRLKRDAAAVVAVALLLAAPPVPRATGRRRVGVAVTVSGRSGLPDPDNLWKVLLDALVAHGLVVDDSSAWCELGGVTVGRAAARRTVITLEDIGSRTSTGS